MIPDSGRDYNGTYLEVTVANVGNDTIGKLKVSWDGSWEPTCNEQLIGKGFFLVPVNEKFERLRLLPGEQCVHALLKPDLQKCLSYAASLSPENYFLSVWASLPDQESTYVIHKRLGSKMSNVIESLEDFLATE